MAAATLNQLLLDTLQRHPKPDLLWHKRGGTWQKISTHEFLTRVASLASALKEFGIQKGDRVAVFSENRPEWHIADLAILGLGAVNVPIYQREMRERLQYLLRDSASRICFVSGAEQFEKVRALWTELPKLERVIPFARSGEDSRVVPWEAVTRTDIPDDLRREFDRTARAVKPDDVASLIYTSGTTGTPKGVLLTQHNFASNVTSCIARLGYGQADVALSLLPLCHVYERMNDYGYLAYGVAIAYAESFEAVTRNLLEVRPMVMAAVPRFFEKFYARIQENLRRQSPLKQKIFHWALAVGRKTLPYRLAGKPLPAGLAWRQRLAGVLVYRKVRNRLGGRLVRLISGGGPLSRELNEFFQALHVPILEGYGLTETSPVIAVNAPGMTKLGTVGKPIPGVEVKIVPDGEILTRGPHVMQGYYKRAEETRKAIVDGWFHTGDLGYLDEEGFLVITGRKRDVIKTAGGKMIAPQPIENRLQASFYIQNALVVGDGRKYAVALLVPNLVTLKRFAREQGIDSSSPEALLESPAVRQLLDAEVAKVNAGLAQFERIKRFALLLRDFNFDDGELTYTQKVRRGIVEERYRALIETLYEREPHP
ncbi:MAG: AMP-dependent synthetase/ligase, partial [Terriglobia bacterium]